MLKTLKIRQPFGYVLIDGKVVSKFDRLDTDVEHRFPKEATVVDTCTRDEFDAVVKYRDDKEITGVEARLIAEDGYKTVQLSDAIDEFLKWAFGEQEITLTDGIKSLASAQMQVKRRYPKDKMFVLKPDGTIVEKQDDDIS